MAISRRDALGQRGELLFSVLMTKYHNTQAHPYNLPIFHPVFLGDKFPEIDFFVMLSGVSAFVPYFFVQVRTTQRGYTQRERRLKIAVAREEVLALARYPAPTYIVGIDEVDEVGYLCSVSGGNLGAVTSLSSEHRISAVSREALWREVYDFWSGYHRTQSISHFAEPRWG